MKPSYYYHQSQGERHYAFKHPVVLPKTKLCLLLLGMTSVAVQRAAPSKQEDTFL